MALEAKVAQKEKLYNMLLISELYLKAGAISLKEVEMLISVAKSGMDSEDIAHVEKQLTERK